MSCRIRRQLVSAPFVARLVSPYEAGEAAEDRLEVPAGEVD